LRGAESSSRALRAEAAIVSDVGLVRRANEDAALFLKRHGSDGRESAIAVLADGMGGHRGGATASRIAVEAVSKSYFAASGDLRAALDAAIRDANAEVFHAACLDDSLAGMGTTCAVLVIQGNRALGAHVGDSRIYFARRARLRRMTVDHTAIAALLAEGSLRSGEERDHPMRGVLTRAIGTAADVEPTIWNEQVRLEPNDRFVLCSDGLHDLVDDDELASAIATDSIHDAARDLVDLAKRRGGHDNISVAIVAVGERAAERAEAGATGEATEIR
jgi:protein phosphatase